MLVYRSVPINWCSPDFERTITSSIDPSSKTNSICAFGEGHFGNLGLQEWDFSKSTAIAYGRNCTFHLWSHWKCWGKKSLTPLTINMEPKNHSIEKENNLNETTTFRFHVNLPGCFFQMFQSSGVFSKISLPIFFPKPISPLPLQNQPSKREWVKVLDWMPPLLRVFDSIEFMLNLHSFGWSNVVVSNFFQTPVLPLWVMVT